MSRHPTTTLARVPTVVQRLRADFQLTIITIFGACGAFAVLPFAVYRFLTEEPVVGAVDTAVGVFICAAVVYAWRSGDTRRTGMLLAINNTAGAMVAAAILGVAGRDWMYVVLLANFFLVGRGMAAGITALALTVLIIHGKAFENTAQMVSFLVTASLVSGFAFIFAARTAAQRLQLEALATRDPLTGVDNRRAMEQGLQIAVETYRRGHATFGLVMLDLDHFNRVNDDHGHDAGDRVLIAFADLIRKSTRAIDSLFRFGGDEFVLLLPGTDAIGLQRVTEGLRRTIAKGLRSPAGAVTSSLGAAVLRPEDDWPSWLARADAALYRAKANGRNRAVIDGAEVAPTG